jgi:hypothetical protein
MKRSLKDLRGRYGQPPHHPVNEHARAMRETFQDDDSRVAYSMDHTWPTRYYEIGQGRSVAYTSNKWKDDDDFEDYKHVAESPNQTFVTDKFLRAARRRRSDLRPNGGEYPECYPEVEFPPTVAELAPFIFFEARPIESYSGSKRIVLAEEAIQVGIPGCILYGCYAKPPGSSWSRKSSLIPFLAVIHKTDGVMAIITGKRLDVKKDGIVGLERRGMKCRAPRSNTSAILWQPLEISHHLCSVDEGKRCGWTCSREDPGWTRRSRRETPGC